MKMMMMMMIDAWDIYKMMMMMMMSLNALGIYEDDDDRCLGHLQRVRPPPLRPSVLRHLHRHPLLLGLILILNCLIWILYCFF